jgi:hypothetical protein
MDISTFLIAIFAILFTWNEFKLIFGASKCGLAFVTAGKLLISHPLIE